MWRRWGERVDEREAAFIYWCLVVRCVILRVMCNLRVLCVIVFVCSCCVDVLCLRGCWDDVRAMPYAGCGRCGEPLGA